jgi:endo-1,4-beta-xylanase
MGRREPSRRSFLTGAGGAALAASWPLRSAATDPGLRDIAAVNGLLYGAGVGPDSLDKTPYAESLARECSIFVPENSMKWGPVEAVRGQLNFSAADRVADFAAAHQAKLRGHTLILAQPAAELGAGRLRCERGRSADKEARH